jgi:hypothetical protein
MDSRDSRLQLFPAYSVQEMALVHDFILEKSKGERETEHQQSRVAGLRGIQVPVQVQVQGLLKKTLQVTNLLWVPANQMKQAPI